MIELFLIRHGEAVGQGSYLGRRSDPPLTDRGRDEVSALKPLLPLPVESELYSSPMRRAVQTAEILFEEAENTVINKIADFSEMDFGEWDGLSWEEISAKVDKEYRAWLDDPVNLSPPGGEKLTEFNSRIDSGFRTVIDHSIRAGVEKIFIVAHGGVIRSIICILLGLPAESHWSFKIDTASVNSIKLFNYAGAKQSCRLDFLNLTAYR